MLQVNDIAFHPVHGTLSTVGSDGRYYFWDKDARTKLKVCGHRIITLIITVTSIFTVALGSIRATYNFMLL